MLKLVDTVVPQRRPRRHATASARRTGGREHRKGHHGRSRENGLWGNGHGNYRTKGHYGSATVRGTIWFVQDRPRSTFFKVRRHTVLVRDFKRHRGILLHAGQHYLARR